MTGKVFVDTDVLIYAYDRSAGRKHEIAKAKMDELWRSRQGRVSPQVLSEFFVFLTRSVAKPIPSREAREMIRPYTLWVEGLSGAERPVRASEISELWGISFWDAMIVAAAEEVGAGRLLSASATRKRSIAGIEVVNPFQELDSEVESN